MKTSILRLLMVALVVIGAQSLAGQTLAEETNAPATVDSETTDEEDDGDPCTPRPMGGWGCDTNCDGLIGLSEADKCGNQISSSAVSDGMGIPTTVLAEIAIRHWHKIFKVETNDGPGPYDPTEGDEDDGDKGGDDESEPKTILKNVKLRSRR